MIVNIDWENLLVEVAVYAEESMVCTVDTQGVINVEHSLVLHTEEVDMIENVYELHGVEGLAELFEMRKEELGL